jgi:hypothetical protein
MSKQVLRGFTYKDDLEFLNGCATLYLFANPPDEREILEMGEVEEVTVTVERGDAQ